ncbi:hypothetical protein MMC09_006188 [Bachmanniomyces sp. S44760]|nr:hypothetical protein [Bachmanniomyces sp. S44760]
MSRDHPTGIYPDAPVTTTTRKLIDERLDLNDLFEHLENDNSMEEDFSMFGATDMDYSTSSSFQPINDPASVQPSSDSVQTVSPQDIFSDNMSAPASGALTNMTTPGSSYQPSPYEYQKSSFMVTSTEQSPYLDADIETTSDWPTLFPEDEGIISTEQSIVDDTMAPPMSRNQSSPGQASSRSSHQGRHSSISGVNARKRDKPLPPIEIKDPHDIIQVKRARNTAAARKSRAKKMERFEDLQAEIDTLKQEVDYWKNMAEAGDRDS